MLERLAVVPDPRDRRGLRHTLVSVLALSAAAVLACARSVAAIAEWAADAPQPVLAALGARRDPFTRTHHAPGEATMRRTLGRIDGDALDAAVGAWLADRLLAPSPTARRAVAVDGKSVRGAASQGGRAVHLLAAMDHTDGAVLAQRQVAGAPEEVPAFIPLLEGLDLADAVVTADALHTHPDAAEFLVAGKHGGRLASSLIATASPRSCSWPAPPPPGGCYLPVLDRLMPVDNLTWFVNDPGRDASGR